MGVRPQRACLEAGAAFIEEGALTRDASSRLRHAHHSTATGLVVGLVLAACIAVAPLAQAAADPPQGRDAMVHSLLIKGQAQLKAGDFQAALAAANEILAIAPTDAKGIRLREEACNAILSDTPSARKARRRGANERLLDQVERELTPQTAADGVVKAGESTPQPAPLVDNREAWERSMDKKLQRPVSVEFHDTPLPDALKQLSALGDLPIVLDPKAEPTRITLPSTRMPLGALLRWVARFAKLQCCMRHGAVYLAATDSTLDEPVRRTYDVSSLMVMPQDAVVRPRERGALELKQPALPPERPTPSATTVANGWVQFIRATVAAGTWANADRTMVKQEMPQYSIAYRNGRIVVLHTPEVHQQIEDLLNNFRKSRHLMVHVSSRFLWIARADLQELNLEGSFDSLDQPPDRTSRFTANLTNQAERSQLRQFPNIGTADSGMSLTYNYLSDNQVSALLGAVRKKRRATLLEAPRLTCFNTQRANFQWVVNINYVRRVTADDEPEIGNLPIGVVFDVQPFVSADRKYITLTLEPQFRQLIGMDNFAFGSDPLEDMVDDLGNPIIQARRVTLPTTHLRSVSTTVSIPNGGTMLIGGMVDVEERTAIAGVPFLKGIPFLGRLFRSRERAAGRRSLLMLFKAETVREVFED